MKTDYFIKIKGIYIFNYNVFFLIFFILFLSNPLFASNCRLEILLKNNKIFSSQKLAQKSSLLQIIDNIFTNPKTTEELKERWEDFNAPDSIPDTDLHKTVEIKLYSTIPGKNAWYNSAVKDSGFYGKILPPLKMSDGREIVPIVGGNLYKVSKTKIIYTSPKRIHIDTLKSLLWILKEHNDSQFSTFLDENQITFDDLINLSENEILKIVPPSLFLHSDNIHWSEYYENNKEKLSKNGFWHDLAIRRYNIMQEVYREYNKINDIPFNLRFADLFSQMPRDYLDIKFAQDKKAIVTIKKLTDKDIEEQFGITPIKLDGKTVSIKASTFKDVVGRLAFLYGNGGFIEAKSIDGKISLPIDSPRDFITAILYGYNIQFIKSRLDIKGMGTISPKIHALKTSERNDEKVIIKDYNPKDITIEIEDSDKVEQITIEDFLNLKTPNIIFGSEYQEGFPSPSGTEVSRFATETLEREKKFHQLVGVTPSHIISQFSFGKHLLDSSSSELIGTLRFTRNEGDRSLRIIEAMQEYKLNPNKSLFGKWKNEGKMKENLINFFKGFGKNQRALLASGKVWINLGGGLMHNQRNAKELHLDETYKFFLYNTDIIDGRQADLGDIMDYSNSINDDKNHPEIFESISIITILISNFIFELERDGFIEKAWIKDFIHAFSKEFTADNNAPVLSEIHHLNDMTYSLKDIKRYGGFSAEGNYHSWYTEKKLERNSLSNDFENFISIIFKKILPLFKYFPVVTTGYDASFDASSFSRLYPGVDLSKFYYLRTKALSLEEYLHLPDYHNFYYNLFNIENPFLNENSQISKPMQNILKSLDLNVSIEEAVHKEIRKTKNDKVKEVLNLFLLLHKSFESQKNFIIMNNQQYSLETGIEKFNKLLSLISLNDNMQKKKEKLHRYCA